MSIVFPRMHRRGVAWVVCVVLLTGTAGCTEDPTESVEPPTKAASTPTPTPRATPTPPTRVRIARVWGRLAAEQRDVLKRRVGQTVSAYFDAAFLDGDYPRTDFSAAFGSFSKGAARKARGDRDLLTNAALGSSSRSVTPVRKRATLYVLAPRAASAGVTARVRLVYLARRDDGDRTRVTVSGRLLLTRSDSGWEIFGYDLARSAMPARRGEGR